MSVSNTPDDDRTVVLQNAGSVNALPAGTKMAEFEIVRLVGEGGFGIVYLAHDAVLQRRVALKEYLPATLASRGSDLSVRVTSTRHGDTFQLGLKSFLNEARLLAQFDHPALVKVYRFWEANGTAYMVMPFYEGVTLKQALQRDGAPDEARLTVLLGQMLDALDVLHRVDCLHRDIAPDNIVMLAGDRPVLLDFGAARRVISDRTQAFTVILKPGYAPIEQYAEVPGLTQGPWTDVYALAGVAHFAITGTPPAPSIGRTLRDPQVPLEEAAAGRYSAPLLRALDRALAVRPEDRPQSVAEFRALLGIGHGHGAGATSNAALATVALPSRNRRGVPAVAVVGGGLIALGVALAAGVYVYRDRGTATEPVAVAPAAIPPTASSPAAVTPPPAPSAAPSPPSAPAEPAALTPAVPPTAPSPRPVPSEPAAVPATAAPALMPREAPAEKTVVAPPPAPRTIRREPPAPPPRPPVRETPSSIAVAPPQAPEPAPAPPAAPNQLASIAAAAIEDGEKCLRSKQYDCAIANANAALRAEPASQRARRLKGEAEEAQRRALSQIKIE